MIFKPLLSKLLPESPKNRLIFTLVVGMLANLCIGTFWVSWQQHVLQNRLSTEIARSYDITLVTCYIFVTSVTYYALQDWVFADGEGCYTLQLFTDTEKTWITSWMVRFPSWPCFCLACIWSNYTILTAHSWDDVLQFRGAFLSGATFILVDLMMEVRAGIPEFFLHHILSAVAILLSAEWGHFEPAILLFGIQLALDKLIWPIVFFSRLMAIRDRVLGEFKDKDRDALLEQYTTSLQKVKLLECQNLNSNCATSPSAASSSNGCTESSSSSTSTPSHSSANEPFAQEEGGHHLDQGKVHLETSSTTIQVMDAELAVSRHDASEEVEEDSPSSSTTSSDSAIQSTSNSSNSSAAIFIPDETLFKKLKMLEAYHHSHERRQSDPAAGAWYIDDLIPTPATMAYLYSLMFVFYALIVRGLTIDGLIVYSVRFWDHVDLAWRIKLPIAGFFFIVVDLTVYRLMWLRSHWGRIGRAQVMGAVKKEADDFV